ncbi:MAG TPA: DegT/DnrJ/EryC1/StrS family aminotransferase, partial [Pirellulales bacterium]
LSALGGGLLGADATIAEREVEKVWGGDRSTVASLSVRSGLDALLTALRWPAGDEVLVSAVTIPDMLRVIEAHGLTPVPLDVKRDSLAPDVVETAARITPRTRAMLIAPLFGSRIPLGSFAELARRRDVSLWEDAAQGYSADGDVGSEFADVSFFSFGTIKAQTALGGACLRFRDSRLAEECRRVQAAWPWQTDGEFRRKVRRALLLQAASSRLPFTIAHAGANAFGFDLDDRLASAVRGFQGDDLLVQIRRRPSRALLALLHYRLTKPDRRWLLRKTELASELRRRLPRECVLGAAADFPTHWVAPILSRDSLGLQSRLRRAGYDATIRASQLRVVPPAGMHPEWQTPEANDWHSRLIYLPLHPSLRSEHLHEMVNLIAEFESAAAGS